MLIDDRHNNLGKAIQAFIRIGVSFVLGCLFGTAAFAIIVGFRHPDLRSVAFAVAAALIMAVIGLAYRTGMSGPNSSYWSFGRISKVSTRPLLATLGFASGILSALFFKGGGLHEWIPGLLFCPVVALVVLRTGRPIAALAVIPVTIFAWWSGYHTASATYGQFDLIEMKDGVLHFSRGDLTAKLLPGFLGGLAGSATLVIGCSLVLSSLRGFAAISSTMFVGSLLGLLLYPALEMPTAWVGELGLLMLFPFWQAGVGACLGYWLDRHIPQGQPQ